MKITDQIKSMRQDLALMTDEIRELNATLAHMARNQSQLSLRDYFAGQVAAGFCSVPRLVEAHVSKDLAAMSYMVADAMLQEREGGKGASND